MSGMWSMRLYSVWEDNTACCSSYPDTDPKLGSLLANDVGLFGYTYERRSGLPLNAIPAIEVYGHIRL